MAFELFTPAPCLSGKVVEARASICFIGRSAVPTLVLTVSARRMAEIGAVIGDRFEVMIGTGEHAGLLRLRKDKGGAIKAGTTPRSDAAQFRLRGVADLASEPQRSEAVRCDAVDICTLEIVLPPWSDRRRRAAATAEAPAPLDAVARARAAIPADINTPPPRQQRVAVATVRLPGDKA